ncbi:AAA domain-containing protein [Murinocardiopsis flavida]|uniref:AAA domain-containing protein n=1 Tax=Murinocardiopsis flavida TaxID=645275 RepID=A0A2P8DUH0_9ACTN|nr:AAA family ATPase [Murinocardiopsis flavida]PSL00878.1 AAA domain-containing protein [Murinocardiopsis flavida]
MTDYEVLLIGGCAGVGKSSVAWEVSAQLQGEGRAHCHIEGDTMDQIHPAPPGDPHRSAITERNLAAVWANYAALGRRLLVYPNTAAVLDADLVVRAMGGSVAVTAVLLQADPATVRARLARREIGSQLDHHVERSAWMAGHLAENAPRGTVRIRTDGRSVADIAHEARRAAAW